MTNKREMTQIFLFEAAESKDVEPQLQREVIDTIVLYGSKRAYAGIHVEDEESATCNSTAKTRTAASLDSLHEKRNLQSRKTRLASV